MRRLIAPDGWLAGVAKWIRQPPRAAWMLRPIARWVLRAPIERPLFEAAATALHDSRCEKRHPDACLELFPRSGNIDTPLARATAGWAKDTSVARPTPK